MNTFSSILRDELIEQRDYQINIATTAIKKNTLIIIPTALGKTIITIMALSKIIEDGGKAIFLAPTKPLVRQHLLSLRKFLKMREDDIVEVTGETRKEDRFEIYQNGKIIVSTPQVIENDLDMFSEIKKDIKVVIFDEAHRAVGDYSYVTIAKYFSPYSRIIATTASPGGEKERIDEIIKNLSIEALEIRDENSPDVMEYIKGIEIKWIRLDMPPELKDIVSDLRELYDRIINKIKNYFPGISGRSRKEIISLNELISQQIKQGNKVYYSVARLRSQAIILDYLLEFIETQGVLPFIKYIDELRSEEKNSLKFINDSEFSLLKERALKLMNQPMRIHTPKMYKILEILKELDYQKSIIFCHFRITASILENTLKENGFSCEKFIGQSSRGEEHGMSQSEQSNIIGKFRSGEIKILVATQVGEEGLDIPAADLVIFYEPVPSEIRSIQRRGRTGRFSKGLAVILVMNDSRDVSYLYISGKKEKAMKNILKDKKSGESQTTFDKFVTDD